MGVQLPSTVATLCIVCNFTEMQRRLLQHRSQARHQGFQQPSGVVLPLPCRLQ